MSVATKIKANIPGWGADLDPANRPGGRREANHDSVLDSKGRGEYDLIPRQVPRVEILVSTEHKKLPPIFGTSCPPHGISGVIRRFAFRFSEGQKSHWLALLLADRVDVIESAIGALLRGEPDNVIRERGLASEFRRTGFPRRFRHHRADTRRWGQQLLLIGGIVGVAAVLRSSRR